jgi:hypothetical protein
MLSVEILVLGKLCRGGAIAKRKEALGVGENCCCGDICPLHIAEAVFKRFKRLADHVIEIIFEKKGQKITITRAGMTEEKRSKREQEVEHQEKNAKPAATAYNAFCKHV